MKSLIAKRSITLAGHKTSVSLEQDFWQCLKEIADERGQAVSDLVEDIDRHREQDNLSSALRLFVLDYYRARQISDPSPADHPAARARVN
jgi:predicted DNA-binding ribbon-helix-helix protein